MQIFLFPPERPPTPSRGPPVRALPTSCAPTHHFPCRSRPRSLQAPKWRTGLQGAFGVLGFSPRSPTAQLSLAPTWAYPCCLLLLPILAASVPLQHFDSQTCRGSGWGQGPAAAGRSAPSRPRVPYPQPPPPSVPRSHARPPPSQPPHPASTTIFSTPRRSGVGRGCGKSLLWC